MNQQDAATLTILIIVSFIEEYLENGESKLNMKYVNKINFHGS